MKQVILIRKDLNMRRGKEIAQGAHASMITLIDYQNDLRMIEWLNGAFTKIALTVESEDQLNELYTIAKNRNMIVSIVIDNGMTEFHGVKTPTAVAIGPDENEIIDEITGHLKLR